MPFIDDPHDNPYAPPRAELTPLPELGPATRATGYAGFWLRFVAYLIDSLALGVLATPMILVWVLALSAVDQTESDELSAEQAVLVIAMYGMMFAIIIIYCTVMESSKLQATLGKLALGLKVTDLQGRRISFGRSLGRAASKLFVTHYLSCLIGYIMAGFTKQKRALHDMIAGTLVVKTRP